MPGARPRVRVGVAAGAAVLGLTGGALVWSAVTGSTTTAPPPPAAAPEPARGRSDGATSVELDRRPSEPRPPARRSPAKGVRDLITGPTLPQSRPVRVAIPRIGVTSRLVDLGLDDAGAMEVPEDPALAGWYTLGPTPGALGPAVIAGHVSWNRAPAVFFRLGELRRGDRVEVAREDGTTGVFAVTSVTTFPKDRFPSRAVFGSTDHAGLRLITCGGDFDSANHRFLHNVVAFARLVRD